MLAHNIIIILPHELRIKALQRWRQKQAFRATYKNLALCFYEAHRPDMVQTVLERLGASFSTDIDDTAKEPASTIVHQTTIASEGSQGVSLHVLS